ncbi:MAG: PQQ-dependent sugar dehydrogenase [Pseudomonadota bacterium]
MRPALTFAALSASLLVLSACSGDAAAPTQTDITGTLTSEDGLKLVPLAEGLEFPWAIAELPGGELLVTEREGRLRLIREGALVDTPLAGLPDDILVARQGGLLDILLAPDFETSRKVLLSYSKDLGDGMNTTAVISASLNEELTGLSGVIEIFRGTPRNTAFHYGSRLAFLPDGSLAIGLGDGYRYMQDAQDPNNLHGKIARILPNGTYPDNNPFATGGGDPGVWSWGHRNVQGLIYDETRDMLFAHEHGPKGGDELNVIEAGKNYGWPAISYGIDYDGSIITDKTEAPGMEQPAVKWVPSIAPSGMSLVRTPDFGDWSGDLLIGAMNGPAGQKLVRVDLDETGGVVGTEDLLDDLQIAYRDVLSTERGLYVATADLDGFVYKVEKAS